MNKENTTTLRARFRNLTVPRSIPHDAKARVIINRLSPAERLVFWVLVGIFTLSAFTIAGTVNGMLLVEVPARGGELTEGIVGAPRFINPLLAISDADRDLTALVYSGLLRATPDGLMPDLAGSYAVSDDGLTYTFTLREDAVFHDGTPVTADDVVFTVKRAQDPALKSSKRANWEGVVVEKLSANEIAFTLERPYTPFLENTTLGILPRHVWENASADQFPFSQFNTEPIGSGPYRVSKIVRNKSGVPESYELASFRQYTLGQPNISTFILRFYSNEDGVVNALTHGEIDAANGISPDRVNSLADGDWRIEQTTLPRIFAVFFNQNHAPVFANKEVRQALAMLVERERIIDDVLGGFGTPAYGPLPATFLDYKLPAAKSREERLEAARKLLEDNGWELDEETGTYKKETDDESVLLSFSLATSNNPELKASAQLVADMWRELGASVDVQFFEPVDLNQNVIRPREYDALLFGEIVGRGLDLFAFWHSSQRNDPGLNIALYANITADDLLEKARVMDDEKELRETFAAFADEVSADIPAVFLYSPDFIYVVPDKLKGLNLQPATTPSERFLMAHKWFIETDSVWTFFQ